MPQPFRRSLADRLAAAASLVGRKRSDRLTHRRALLRLKAAGFEPATVYDIGAYRGGWTRLAAEIFPAATFILFEANGDNAVHLQSTGRRHFIVTVSDEDGSGTLFLPRTADTSGASLYVENSAHYAGGNRVERAVATARLDTLVARHDLPPPDLIKLDVQGAELDAIAGGAGAVAQCRALIAELSLASYNQGGPLIAEAMAAIARRDLHCIDICELHCSPHGTVLQADFLFAKPALFAAVCKNAGINPPPGTSSQRR
jgi:FkbM family methyltransferase